jgi:hypothetical protein
MNRSLALSLVVVLLAVLIGCKRKQADETQPAEDGDATQNGGDERDPPGGGQTAGREGKADTFPPWPPLPEVPNRTLKYPNTPGGLLALALDNVADDLISHAPPETEFPGSWHNYCFRRAFNESGQAIADFPKAPIGKEKEWFAPAGTSGRERALLDKTFDRFLAAATRYWELDRRWNIERDLALLRRVMPRANNKQRWAEATKTRPPNEEIHIDSTNLATGTRWKYDLYRLDVRSQGSAKWSAILVGGGRVTGRVEVAGTFEMTTALLTGVLTGSVGEELILGPFGPCVLDLSELKAPSVRLHTGDDVLLRVGPGIQSIDLAAKRGVILARGAPKLRVKFHGKPSDLAIVNY